MCQVPSGRDTAPLTCASQGVWCHRQKRARKSADEVVVAPPRPLIFEWRRSQVGEEPGKGGRGKRGANFFPFLCQPSLQSCHAAKVKKNMLKKTVNRTMLKKAK